MQGVVCGLLGLSLGQLSNPLAACNQQPENHLMACAEAKTGPSQAQSSSRKTLLPR